MNEEPTVESAESENPPHGPGSNPSPAADGGRSAWAARVAANLPPPSPPIRNRPKASRRAIYRSAVAAISILMIILALYFAFDLTRPLVPGRSGGAAFLVAWHPGTHDSFHLDLQITGPKADRAIYSVTSNCNIKAKRLLLVLWGNARFKNPQEAAAAFDGGTQEPTNTSVSERNAHDALSAGEGLGPEGKSAVQIFTIHVASSKCWGGGVGVDTYLWGSLRGSLETYTNASHIMALPTIGTTGSVARGYYSGNWQLPRRLTVSAGAGDLPVYDQVALAKPSLNNANQLYWRAQNYIAPTVTWTNTLLAARIQFFLIVLGAAIGIFASLLFALIIEWLRV